MGLCAVSRWCEGCRNKGKAQLSSAPDRISERITLAFQTLLSRSEAKNWNFPYISMGYGGESVSQSQLKDNAFSISLHQNPPFELPPKMEFRLRQNCPAQWPVIDNTAIKRLAKGKLPSHRSA
jgi:hypothetical protein